MRPDAPELTKLRCLEADVYDLWNQANVLYDQSDPGGPLHAERLYTTASHLSRALDVLRNAIADHPANKG